MNRIVLLLLALAAVSPETFTTMWRGLAWDPNGSVAEAGAHADPDGTTTDAGSRFDPNGGTSGAESDFGSSWDPNG